MVTHNVGAVEPISDLVVQASTDGHVSSREPSSGSELIRKEIDDAQDIQDTEQTAKDDKSADEMTIRKGKLVAAEEIEIGHIGRSAGASPFNIEQYVA
jgi:hypothetical protein